MTEVGRDGVHVGFHRNWCYGSKSKLCCNFRSMRRNWWVEFLRECFGLNYHFRRLKFMRDVSNKKPVYWSLRRCEDGDYLIKLWELNCYKGRLRGSQVYTSKFHKWNIWTVFEEVKLCRVFQRINGRWSIENERVILRVDEADVARCLDGCTLWTYPFWVIGKLRINQVVLRLASYA